MISLETLAADLYRSGYRSVEQAELDGRTIELNKREEMIVDCFLLKLWKALPASELPTARSFP